ncbi:MAG: hypothetical protein KAT48_11030 [Bacteroidales bacterium]|nr:hypothetical protein [Bacteroidales bacterium]
MEKKSKVPLVYGYAVCVAAVITFLISAASLVNAIIDLGDPMHAVYVPAGSPSLVSFENYKMDILKSPEKEQAYVPDDQTLQAMYQAAKDDRIQLANHRSNRSLIVSGMLILICVVLFLTHWKWMQKLSKKES